MAKTTDTARLGYKELKAELRGGTFRRLYVMTGDEIFLIDKLIMSIQDLLIAPGAQTIDSVHLIGGAGSKITIEKLKSEVLTPPFLSRCKVVVVKNSGLFASAERSSAKSTTLNETSASSGTTLDNDTGFGPNQNTENTGDDDDSEVLADPKAAKSRQQDLIKLLSDIPDSACLIFIEQKVDKRQKAVIAAIEQQGVLAEIVTEQPALLRQWVEAECRQRQLTIEPLAAESLVDRCDNSMQVIWQEMTKIFLYVEFAKQTKIDQDLIEKLSLPDLRGNIFDMTDAISKGNTARALELLDLLLGQKEPAQLIAFMLARHFRQLIVAKDLNRSDAIIRDLKVMPFVANRLLQQAKALSAEQMETIYGLCFETDLSVKTGQLGERLALELLLVSAAEAAKPRR
ncbi:MAG: DNA polymerase III subunit delta [Eubacteriales bacterium]|nr:DNA polymerase III subunit delta [Eubacteriales bacterium]